MSILEKKLTVNNRKGIHGRIAAEMIKIAGRHNVKFCIIFNSQLYECPSVLDILSIALVHGATFTIRAVGNEPDDAINAVEKLIEGTEKS